MKPTIQVKKDGLTVLRMDVESILNYMLLPGRGALARPYEITVVLPNGDSHTMTVEEPTEEDDDLDD